MATETGQKNSVVDTLEQHKAAHSGEHSLVLLGSGIEATWPQFQPSETWPQAFVAGKKHGVGTDAAYVALLCRFNGEKIAPDELPKRVSEPEIQLLIAKVFGDEKPSKLR